MGASQHINRGGGTLVRRQELVEIFGYFEPNGTANPTYINMPGVKSVVRTGVGAYTVTLDDSYYEVQYVSEPVIQTAAATNAWCQVTGTSGAKSSANASFTIQIYNVTSGASTVPVAQEFANAPGPTGTRIHLHVCMARRSV